ncbi:MAG: alpha/beta hydrolase [Lachnospiraceae bacterium]|nr:alpha/beta hydrolase [Lachnospiraceae bacterium]
MYYKECGSRDGQLVIFIHGGFTTHESFMKQYNLLPDKRMIFVDLPGCGNSVQEGADGFSFDRAAYGVMNLVERLSPDRKVILIAHSYGGLIVKEVLMKIPDRIEKVVVGSTNVQRSLLFWLYTRKIGCHILWKQNNERYEREQISWKCVCDMQKDAWHKFDISKLKSNSQLECLFLCAEHDIKEIRNSMKLWKEKMPNCKLCEVPQSGHNYFWDMPEIVNPLIADFCK